LPLSVFLAHFYITIYNKTQVISATLTGDHRTRLTHTLEVEQIAISIADALGLNKDLVSAIALGHDVGHTPFGHAAERTLNDKLQDIGGFHHPIQSVKYLWEKYGDKLIDEIYEGILAHDSDMYTIKVEEAEEQLQYVHYSKESTTKTCKEFSKFLNKPPGTLEAQSVIWADKIAYITHDLEDFLHSSIYTSVIKDERSGVFDSKENVENTEQELCKILSSLTNKPIASIGLFKSRDLIRAITTNLIQTSAENISGIDNLKQEDVQKKTIERLNKNAEDISGIDNLQQENVQEKTIERVNKKDENEKEKKRYLNSLIINFDASFRELYYSLRKLLNQKYILSTYVQRSDAKAQNIISSLYEQFIKNYKLTPLEIRRKIDDEIGKLEENKEDEGAKITKRIVASYISTMSDTYAEDMFCNLNASKDNYNL
jgi:dGTPase